MTVLPSLKATFPWGVRVPLVCWTVAVKVTGSPVLAGLLLEVRVVVVGRSSGSWIRVGGWLVAPVMVMALLRVNNRPMGLARRLTLMALAAMRSPRKVVKVSRVAELLITQ